MLLAAPVVVPAIAAPAFAQTQTVAPGDVVLSEYLTTEAGGALRGQVEPVLLERSATLLQAARRLNPDNARAARMDADVQLRLGDAAAALAALSAYRALSFDNQLEELTQVQLIDLMVQAEQSAEAKLTLLLGPADAETGERAGGLMAAPAPDRPRRRVGLSDAVKAHVAMKAAEIFMAQGRQSRANAMIDRAIELNEVYPLAADLRYSRLPDDASPAERAEALFTMLRANPVRPQAMTRLAGLFADVGLVAQSLDWYKRGFELGQAIRISADVGDYLDYAAVLFITDQPNTARQIAREVLNFDEQNVTALFLKLLAEKRLGDTQALQTSVQQTRDVLLKRLIEMTAEATGQEVTPGQVAAPQLPDVVSAARTIRESGDEALAQAYAASLRDLALLDMLVAEAEPAAPVLEAVRVLLGESHPQTARLEGWAFLTRGRTDEARVKLEAVADEDPIARAGLLQIDPSLEAAQALLDSNSSGLLGAMAFSLVADLGLQPQPGEDADAVLEKLYQFPQELLEVIERPDTFYNLRATPLRIANRFGEAVELEVTIQNISEFPLSIGPDGVIRPEVQIEVVMQGRVQQNLPGVAVATLAETIRLDPREQVRTVVRLDPGALRSIFRQVPAVPLTLHAKAITNAMFDESGLRPGPAGVRVQATKPMQRVGQAVLGRDAADTQANLDQLRDRLFQGEPSQQFQTAEFLTAYVNQFREQMAEQPQLRDLAGIFGDALRRVAGNDDQKAVRDWARAMLVTSMDEARRDVELQRLLSSSDWQTRLTGVLVLPRLPAEEAKAQLAKVAEADQDQTVAALARLTIAAMEAEAARAAEAAEAQAAEGGTGR